MIDVARGPAVEAPAGSLAADADFQSALALRPEGRVSLTWLPTGRMTHFLAALLRPGAMAGTRVASLDGLRAAPGGRAELPPVTARPH
jgi:hypothetical protein